MHFARKLFNSWTEKKKSKTGKPFKNSVSELKLPQSEDVQVCLACRQMTHGRPTVRMAVSATSLLMRPSVRALRARLTNHMQGTQNLLWGEGKSSRCLSSSEVIKPERHKHSMGMKAVMFESEPGPKPPLHTVSSGLLKRANRAGSFVLYVIRLAAPTTVSFGDFSATSYLPAPDGPWWETSCRRQCWRSGRWARQRGWRIASGFVGSAWRPRQLHGHDHPLMLPSGPARGRSQTGPTNGTQPRWHRTLVKKRKEFTYRPFVMVSSS